MRDKEAIKRAQKRYEARGVIKRKVLKLHAAHDADIISHIEKLSNLNGYLKQLIREDIKKTRK